MNAKRDEDEPKDLSEVIDDFRSINDELARLGSAAQELMATVESLQAARASVETASAEARATYDEAISAARRLVEQSIKDNKVTLQSLIDDLAASAEQQRASTLEMIASIRDTANDALDAGQRDHRDTASRLQAVITSLKDSGRDLADTAAAFRRLDPEVMQQQVDLIRAEASRIKTEGRLAIGATVVTLGILLVVLL